MIIMWDFAYIISALNIVGLNISCFFYLKRTCYTKMTPCLELQLLPCVLQWIMLIQLDYVYDFDRYGPLSYRFLHLVCIAPIICFSTFFLGLQIATVSPLFATGGAAWCVIPDYGCEWKILLETWVSLEFFPILRLQFLLQGLLVEFPWRKQRIFI